MTVAGRQTQCDLTGHYGLRSRASPEIASIVTSPTSDHSMTLDGLMENGEILSISHQTEDIAMRQLFNIQSETDLEAFLAIYIQHLENDLHLPQKHINKTKEKMAKLLTGNQSYAEVLHSIQHHGCKKCGNQLDELGFCEDTTCIHNDWPQSVRWKSNTDTWTPVAEDQHLKRQRIDAYANSDDHAVSVNCFDAAPFFSTLSDQSLLHCLKNLADELWGPGDQSDELALYFNGYQGTNPNYQEVAAIFEHNADLPNDVEERGFSCGLHNAGIDLMLWIKQNRSSEVYEQAKLLVNDE